MIDSIDLGEDEIERRLKKDSYFSKLLNLTFKKFLETENSDVLNNFETAVVFIMRRKGLIKNQGIDEFYVKTEEQDKLIGSLKNEIEMLKNKNKDLASRFKSMDERIERINIANGGKSTKKKRKSFCNIC